MRLTKFTHACVRLDNGDRTLVIDPGVFSEKAELQRALDGVEAVLITHEHADHVDVDALTAAARSRPRLRVWCPESVARLLPEFENRVTIVEPGQSFDAGGFGIRTYGGQHALIHSSVPPVSNIGYLVDETVYHPGDSFVVPNAPVSTLLVPIHAPWSKVAEALNFLIAVRPKHAHQIHDGLLNDRGLASANGHLDRISRAYGVGYEPLDNGTSAELA